MEREAKDVTVKVAKAPAPDPTVHDMNERLPLNEAVLRKEDSRGLETTHSSHPLLDSALPAGRARVGAGGTLPITGSVRIARIGVAR